MKIKKAIVAVAGSGTRFLPATKAMPKEMLPVVDKPIIQLVVEELVEAGIEDIILVTKWDKKPLEDHFDHSWALENSLKESGKLDYLKEVKRVAELANFVYVRQKGPYGTGTPILSAASLVRNEPFVFCYGDDLVRSKKSFTLQMVEEYEKNPHPIMGMQEVAEEEVIKYGIAKLKEGTMQMEGIVEKPEKDKAPSRLASFGRMILNQEIIDILKNIPLGKNNELQVVDAIDVYIQQGGQVFAKKIEEGEWLTTGDPLNHLKAVLKYAMEREGLRDELKIFIERELSAKK